MKAQDLREVSLILYNGLDYKLSDVCDNYEHINDAVNNGIIKPIPLTEEWLLKMKFSKIGGIFKLSINQLNHGNWVFAIGLDGSFGIYQNEYAFTRGSSFSNETKINSVHQLQNLFHSLTCEELTINN